MPNNITAATASASRFRSRSTASTADASDFLATVIQKLVSRDNYLNLRRQELEAPVLAAGRARRFDGRVWFRRST